MNDRLAGLSQEALTAARNAIRVDLIIRQRAFPTTLSQRGVVIPGNRLYNSRAILVVHQAIKDEYAARAGTVWSILLRLIEAEKVSPSRDLAALAKAELRRAFDNHCGDLIQVDEQAKQQARAGNWPDHFNLKEEALARTDAEIDIELLPTRRAPAVHSTTVNIINPIGVVQTGAGATAVVHQTFGESHREALREALRQVRDAIEHADSLPAEIKADVVAVIGDADAEVKAASPNLLRLRGALSAIASTIQTLGSTAGAYELLKAAALYVGVQLP